MRKPDNSIAKHCRVCGEFKLISDFHKHRHVCIDCVVKKRKLDDAEKYKTLKHSPEYKARQAEGHRKRNAKDRARYLQKKHEAYLRNKEWYNANWHARRAIKAGATEVDRSITISKLIERDKGICGICNLAVMANPKKHNDKPSIDHIVPIKRGGQHTWENVRLVHCGCNNSRGNRADGEFIPNTSFLSQRNNSANQQSAIQPSLPFLDVEFVDFSPNGIDNYSGRRYP